MYAVAAWNELGVDASGREVFVPATGLARVWVSQRVLVRTGKFHQDTLDRWAADEFAMQPNHVIDSVADLPALLEL